jgi:hypothetical protein
MHRRSFLFLPVGLWAAPSVDVAAIDRKRIVTAADRYLKAKPVTITASSSPRSAGGKHDFFSEGDYWWPDPKNPNGPYIQRDGMTNPDNFTDHRKAMIRLSIEVPALVAAWKVTRQNKYADHASAHLRAWFADEATRMNPSLLYAQAIKGLHTGRGIGVIDTLHLVEVARAASLLPPIKGVKEWFAQYLEWMTTHQYGVDERNAKNNHGTCWTMQVAGFAHFTGNQKLMDECRERFKTLHVPGQIDKDGSFPLEMRRTKPYGYSLFNLDAMAGIAQILSNGADSLWKFETADGRGMRKAMAFMFPFIEDKKKWPKPPDVMYHDQWPVRHASLLFAGLALDKVEYVELWKKLNPDPTVEETIRNYPLRQPVLWVG